MLYLGPRSPQETTLSWPERMAQLAEQATAPCLRDFYQGSIIAGQTPVHQLPFIAVDFETTGLNPNQHSIISIGLVPFTSRRIYCAQAQHWLIRPQSPLLEDSITIHGITHSELAKAPAFRERYRPLLHQLTGRLMVVHHRAIERPFLNAALKQEIGAGITFPVVDTMELEARLHRNRSRSWRARLFGHKPASIRLGDSRQRYGLPHYPPHHALTDALATAELLQAQLQHHFSPDTLAEELWC